MKLLDYHWHLVPPHIASPPSVERIVSSLFESMVMAAWRLSIDTSSDGLSLRRFKNQVVDHIPDANTKAALVARIKAAAFEAEVKDVEAKLTELRHKYFAHLDLAHALAVAEGRESPARIDFQSLKDYTLQLKRMLDLVWFGGRPRRFFSDNFNTTNASELDGWLLDILRQSGLLTLADDDPTAWLARRTSMTLEEVAWLNEWRRRAKLPDAPWQ
jgi:hypothetical protein